MLNYSYLSRYPDLFPAVIGISHSQFISLLPKFSQALKKVKHKKAWSKPRIRTPGGGRKPHLRSDFEKLIFILLYYKVYPTFRLAQVLFGFDKRNVQLWVRFLEKVLFKTLGYQLTLPTVKAKTVHGLFKVCPALKEFIVDSTERFIQRSKDYDIQKFYYSGKKKAHTVKDQLIVHPKTKRILAVSKTYEGKRSDKKIFEDDPLFLKLPPGSTGMGDLAYQGIKHPFLRMVIPNKSPPKGKLTDEEKNVNKAISSIRVRSEHPISYLKHFNILAHRFRNSLKYSHLPFLTISAIYNFTRTRR
jgi:hypothetical protein